MKVKLLRDVSIPQGGVGTIGQVVEMTDHQGKEYIRAGLAKEVEGKEDSKADKDADERKTKPGKGPAETK